MLRDGSDIGVDHTAIGQDIAGLLTQADALVNSIGEQPACRTCCAKRSRRSTDPGPELARLIQSSRLLVDEANANYGQTTQLIDQAGPFLDAQIRSGDDIRSLADGLARFTTEARQGRSAAARRAADRARRRRGGQHHVRRHPADVPDAGRQPGQPRPHRRDLPQVDRAGAGDLPGADGRAASPSPAGCPPTRAASSTSRSTSAIRRRARRASFRRRRSGRPRDTTLRDLPTDLYCKTAQNDPVVVRGARNYPCQEFPGKRAPTVQLCRDPRGYVPIGTNPWRGPPVPYGSTPDHTSRPRTSCRPTSSRTFRRGRTTTRAAGRCSCRRVCRPGRVPRRTRRSRCRCRRTTTGRRRRRGRTTRRRTRSCRRTAGTPPEAPAPPAPGPLPAEPPAPTRPRRTRRHCPSTARQPQASGAGDHHVRFEDRCVRRPRRGHGRLRRRHGQGRARGDVGGPDAGSTRQA